MTPNVASDDGSTPVDADETAALIPRGIVARAHLNLAEQANIVEAELWALHRRRDVLSESFICYLHRRMFGKVWRWAGTYRRSDKNIGLSWHEVPVALRALVDDAKTWIDLKSFQDDEIATRFHHRLVTIHPFVNGNGRLARLATDLLLIARGQSRFTWGAAGDETGRLEGMNQTRARYIAALRAADAHDYTLLIRFVRS